MEKQLFRTSIVGGLTLNIDEYLYVSDLPKNEVRRWKVGEIDEILMADGNRLNQLYHIFVDQDQSVYVFDGANHRVM